MSVHQPLPGFFIVGAAKAGTTSLYNYLKQHPAVFLPTIKEVNFFCSDINPANFRSEYAKSVRFDFDNYVKNGMTEEIFHGFIQEWKQYIKIFEKAGNKTAIGELSNTYLFSEVAAKKIHEKFPDAKIIMMLRNPVERVYSHYLMDQRMGIEKENFIDALKADMEKQNKGWGISNLYYELGMYSEQVSRYFSSFAEQQILVLKYDDFIRNAAAELKKICLFLKVDENFQFNTAIKYNQAAMPRNKFISLIRNQKTIASIIKKIIPEKLKAESKNLLFSNKNVQKMNDYDRVYLKSLYHDDIEKLSSITHLDFSDWLKK